MGGVWEWALPWLIVFAVGVSPIVVFFVVRTISQKIHRTPGAR
jgi:hypothetical protein